MKASFTRFAAEGDASGLATLSLMADLMFASAPSVWGESVAKVTSTDYIWEPDRDYLAELMPEDAILGASVSTLGFAGARGWPGNLISSKILELPIYGLWQAAKDRIQNRGAWCLPCKLDRVCTILWFWTGLIICCMR